ncbi:class I SAM-dependent methyltransferase, partial [Salmonella enterica]|uniref:class I SAM-dependent methyltransferase n=1 Tax=Salmonella enterica TaxID=28901 RepID=UPI0032B49295
KFGFVANYGQAVVDLLKPQRGETILDLGCGTGELSHEIYSHGAQVLAVDSSPDMIAAARQKYAAISHQPNNARPGNLIFELAD